MIRNIRKEFFYQSQPEIIWEALTNPEEISAWLMATSDFAPEEGATFTMQAKPMGKWDGRIYGKILVAQKPRLLSYTWKGDQMKSNTIVKWTLLPKDNGTLLILEHTGFSGLADYILGVFHSMGWNKFLKKLNTHISKNGKKKV